jgi:hypothetical protein
MFVEVALLLFGAVANPRAQRAIRVADRDEVPRLEVGAARRRAGGGIAASITSRGTGRRA